MDRAGIICAGNWIVDLVHDIDHWPDESDLVRIGAQTRGMGGGAANVIGALARLQTGLALWPMGAVGDDEQGRFILDECRRLGLPTERLAIKAKTPTAHTHVMSVAGRSRTFFYQGGANDALAVADFPAGSFAETPARIFYLGYLTLLGELDQIGPSGRTNAAEVLARAGKAGMATAVDLVSIPHVAFQDIVASAAPFIDYLIANEVEAARGAGMDPETPLAEMAGALLGQGVRKAVIVHSVEEAVWVGADGETLSLNIPPVPPDGIASNLGAGDAFCAGLLYGVHEGWEAARALNLAIQVAKASLKGVTATSAIPPLADLGLE